MEITQDLAFITLRFGGPRKTAKCSEAALKAMADREGIDPERLKANNRLFTGPAFEAIESHERKARARLKELAIATPNGLHNVYVLPAGVAQDAYRQLEEDRQERADLIDSFLSSDYDTEREAARVSLNGEFKEEFFPPAEQARANFKMNWTTFAITTPEGLPPEEAEKLRENMETVLVECRAALRETLAQLVEHLADKLRPAADGKKKRMFETDITNLTDFLDVLEKRDVTSDTAIRELGRKAREVIGDVTKDELKNSIYGKQRIRDGLTVIKAELDRVIQTEKGRKIDLDLE